MPYQGLSDGLYLAAQPAEKSGVRIEHYSVLDIGNTLQHSQADGSHPIVIHQTPPHIRADWLANTGRWNVMGRVTDVPGATRRLNEAFTNPQYELFGNNCEHFARFVTEGTRRSDQIFLAGVGAVAVGALALYLFKGVR